MGEPVNARRVLGPIAGAVVLSTAMVAPAVAAVPTVGAADDGENRASSLPDASVLQLRSGVMASCAGLLDCCC